MALILKPNSTYTTNSGLVSDTAYLRFNKIDMYSKDSRTCSFYLDMYKSKADYLARKNTISFIPKQDVTGGDYDTWFSHTALENDRNLQDRIYSYLLDGAQKYTQELADYELLSNEEKVNYQFQYTQFAWLQGDIWVSDEI